MNAVDIAAVVHVPPEVDCIDIVVVVLWNLVVPKGWEIQNVSFLEDNVVFVFEGLIRRQIRVHWYPLYFLSRRLQLKLLISLTYLTTITYFPMRVHVSPFFQVRVVNSRNQSKMLLTRNNTVYILIRVFVHAWNWPFISHPKIKRIKLLQKYRRWKKILKTIIYITKYIIKLLRKVVTLFLNISHYILKKLFSYNKR